MPLNELFPAVNKLTHQDKLRLIHFLLLAVAKEEGFNLNATPQTDLENQLLNQLASTEAVVWSPQADPQAVAALSELLTSAQGKANA